MFQLLTISSTLESNDISNTFGIRDPQVLLNHKFPTDLCTDILSPETASISRIMFVGRRDFAGSL